LEIGLIFEMNGESVEIKDMREMVVCPWWVYILWAISSISGIWCMYKAIYWMVDLYREARFHDNVVVNRTAWVVNMSLFTTIFCLLFNAGLGMLFALTIIPMTVLPYYEPKEPAVTLAAIREQNYLAMSVDVAIVATCSAATMMSYLAAMIVSRVKEEQRGGIAWAGVSVVCGAVVSLEVLVASSK